MRAALRMEQKRENTKTVFVHLSQKLLSSHPFHRHSISPSTASANYGTHLDFATMPYNIDIFLQLHLISFTRVEFLIFRRRTSPKPQLEGRANFLYLAAWERPGTNIYEILARQFKKMRFRSGPVAENDGRVAKY